MEYFIGIFIILIYSICFSLFFKRKIDETIKIGVLEIILIIYIAGLFDNLKLGVWIVVAMALIQLIAILYWLCIQKDKNKIIENIKRITTPGLVVYISLCIIFAFLNKDRMFTLHGEFNHWATLVKNMYKYNTFGTNPESIITFNEYPPLTAIFQYFFLGIKGLYSEATIITAHNILYFSVIITIMKNIEWNKNIKKLLLIVPVIVFLPMLFVSNFYLNIVVDGILGVLFALALYEHYEKDEDIKFKYIKICSSILMLALIKTSGLALAVLALVIILIKIFIDKKQDKSYFKKELLVFGICLSIIVILVGVWYLKVSNVRKEWDFSQYIENDNKTQEQQESILKAFVKSVFFTECITDKKITVFICTLVIICCNFYILNKIKEKSISNYRYYFIWLIISIPIFLIGLVLSYIAIFTNDEAQFIVCLDRYTSTIWIANMMFQMLVLFSLDIKINWKTYFIIYTVILFFLPVDIIQEQYIDGKNFKSVTSINRQVYTTLTNYQDILDENDSIFFVVGFRNNVDLVAKMNRYEIMPTKILDYSDGMFSSAIDLEEQIPEECKYIYIYRMEDDVKEKVKSLFKNMEIKNDTLYEIVRINGDMCFEPVYY